MAQSPTRVGFLHDGAMSAEQHAAMEWLRGRDVEVEPVEIAGIEGTTDVLWWHREEPAGPGGPLRGARPALDSFLRDCGGLLLTLRGMEAVTDLPVESVGPDAASTETIEEPTGVLWRRLYDDHPAVGAFDGLRIPVHDRGEVPVARYESVLPAEGEVLAGTLRGDRDHPHEMPVVSWDAGGGVLGVGTPLSFDEPTEPPLEDARDGLLAGCLDALAGGDCGPGRPETARQLAAMRDRLDGDRSRPRYHVTPPANWLNDPNGLIEWNGRYHLFYQYNPAGPFHNTIHWGHAVSDDLVTWRDEPVALAPSPDGPDRDGCWSGCAVDDDGTPAVLYTGGHGRTQLPCLATADDDSLRRWHKHDDNPVIEEPPAGVPILETEHWEAEFRDHCVWRENDTWYHIIGTGLEDGCGGALLYRSEDLRNWRYEGPLLTGEKADGTVWECPELLDLGDKRLLHVSNYEEVVYFLGELREGAFEVEHRGVLDHGDFYAPQSLWDGDRYLTWGWLPEARDLGAQWDAGWSGALSLPRVLVTGDDGRLRQRPAPEIETLRERRLADLEATTLDDERRTLGVRGRAVEVQFEVALTDASAFELSVFESPDRSERTPVRYTQEGELLVDRSRSSDDERATVDTQRMPVTPYDEPLSVRAFLDGSVVELYVNRRDCLTSRVYPTRADGTGISVAAEDGRATVRSLSAWELGSAIGTDRTHAEAWA